MKRINYIHLSPDSDVGTAAEVPSIEDDILGGTSWSEVDRSMPLLPEGMYNLQVMKVEKNINATKGTTSLKITMKTTEDHRAVGTGDTLHKGFPVFHYLGLTPSPEFTKEKIQRSIALFLDATPFTAVLPLEQFEEKKPVIGLQLQIAPEKNGFPESNKVKKWVPLKK